MHSRSFWGYLSTCLERECVCMCVCVSMCVYVCLDTGEIDLVGTEMRL